MDTTDVLSLIMSALAIIVSVTTAIVSYFAQKWSSAIEVEADICFKIYFEHLVHKIPMARDYILYNDRKLSDTDKLRDVLNDLRQDSLFFKYRDKAYFDNLSKKLQDLEDYLLDSEGDMEHEEFAKFTEKIGKNIEEIYQIIMEEYSGMRERKHIGKQ